MSISHLIQEIILQDRVAQPPGPSQYAEYGTATFNSCVLALLADPRGWAAWFVRPEPVGNLSRSGPKLGPNPFEESLNQRLGLAAIKIVLGPFLIWAQRMNCWLFGPRVTGWFT